MRDETNPKTPDRSEKKPPLGSWGRMYAVVLGFLAVEIVVFYLFTRFFE